MRALSAALSAVVLLESNGSPGRRCAPMTQRRSTDVDGAWWGELNESFRVARVVVVADDPHARSAYGGPDGSAHATTSNSMLTGGNHSVVQVTMIMPTPVGRTTARARP